jgi:hypothetical protein
MELTQVIGGILHPTESFDKSIEDDTNEIYPKTSSTITDRTRRISIPMDFTQSIGGIITHNNNGHNLIDSEKQRANGYYYPIELNDINEENKFENMKISPYPLIKEGFLPDLVIYLSLLCDY